MSRTVFNLLILTMIAVPLGGCGVAQTVKEGTTSTAEAIFYKPVRTLYLDFNARTTLNTDAADMSALSLPTLVRVYQLRDSKALERATYDGLLNGDDSLLDSALLDKRAVVVKPGAGAQLTVPMDKQARVVALVALFRSPDTRLDTWRLMLTRDDLDPDRARVIEMGDNHLTLRPLPKE
ncbi:MULTISPECIES: type VI secretion system lipoprotein TssJ [unclassified Pseudomonas]|uniref:type VI secretion system lipoprotein TssJ n=1 Tax=unclassified Pseudomonas TaxID=196821 RepID=UPI0030DCFEA6